MCSCCWANVDGLALWKDLWTAAPTRFLLMRPLRAFDCKDVDCLGADVTGDCLCYVHP
eukprot:SAG31_NODE_3039_length_4757_cov_2.892228_4_plen_58_part_00